MPPSFYSRPSANACRFRAREFVPDEGPWDPFSGAAGALMGTATSMMMGVADMPIQTLKLLQIHPDSRSRKGKEKATGTETPSSGEPSRAGRSQMARTTTSTTEPSAVSGASTPTTTLARENSNDLARSQSNNTGMASPGTPGTPTHRSTFMSQAFAESTERSRSSSRERARHLAPEESAGPRRRASSISAAESKAKNGTQPGLAESVESAMDTGKGLARIIGAGFRSPMDFSLNVAKGFHNVPKLYGADVRQVDKVTDLQSGLRTAAKVWPLHLHLLYANVSHRNSALVFMMGLLVL